MQGSGKLDKHEEQRQKRPCDEGKFQMGAQRPRRQAKGAHQGRKGVCHLLLTEMRGSPWPSLSSWLMCVSHPGSLASTQERWKGYGLGISSQEALKGDSKEDRELATW